MLLTCRFDGGILHVPCFVCNGTKVAGCANLWSCRSRILRDGVSDFSRDSGIEFCVSRDGKSRVGTRRLGLVVGRVDECGSVAGYAAIWISSSTSPVPLQVGHSPVP
jgi:hypothetical protein